MKWIIIIKQKNKEFELFDNIRECYTSPSSVTFIDNTQDMSFTYWVTELEYFEYKLVKS